MPDVRSCIDAPDESLHRSAVESMRQELAAQPEKPITTEGLIITFLVLKGPMVWDLFAFEGK
jgi:hypothetical protein